MLPHPSGVVAIANTPALKGGTEMDALVGFETEAVFKAVIHWPVAHPRV
jgi:hypothetical protein